MSALQHKNLMKPWHDGLINPGSLWREDIERNLADMDVFIGLLTNAFVASDFIQSVEVEAALKKLNESGRDFLFFLILLDDIPLKGLSVDRFQVIKPFGRSVSQCKNRREGFNEAQREIEAKIREVQAKRRGKNR